MTTKIKKNSSRARARQNSVAIGTIGSGFLGYFIAEFTLAGRPHPLHWVVMVMAGLIGYAGGWLWPSVRDAIESARMARRKRAADARRSSTRNGPSRPVR